MFDTFYDDLINIFADLMNPQKRIFIGYILSGFMIGIIALVLVQRHALRSVLSTLFNRIIWFGPSARADYALFIINRIVFAGPIGGLLRNGAVATFIYMILLEYGGMDAMGIASLPNGMMPIAFTLVLFVLDDASKYWVHRWLHTIPFLWCFHRVHHTAETLTPLTVFRTHPVEGILFSVRGALVQGVVIGLGYYLVGGALDLWTVLGGNGFVFLFNVLGSNLRHSPIWLSYGTAWERWFLSPAQHQIHHSIEQRHYDQNFGVCLAFWDRWGGTWCQAEGNKPVGYGVSDGDADGAKHNVVQLYVGPITDAVSTVLTKISTFSKKANP